jgi:D-alanyl-D-alanine dipeptidase
MEVLNPHGGGLPSASRWVPLSGTQPPPTPTPTYRGAPRALEMPADLKLDLSNSEYSRAPSRASSRSSRSTQSAQDIRKRGHLGLSLDPGRNLHKQCQALAELLENQELKRQIELEIIQAHIDQKIEAQIAQQRAREQQYEARIEALEKQVQQLQQAQATQTISSACLKPTAVQTAPQTTISQGLQGPQHPQGRQAEFLIYRLYSRATSKAPRPSKSKAIYADITALLNTNPRGQEWQTVTKNRYQKTPRTQTDIILLS